MKEYATKDEDTEEAGTAEGEAKPESRAEKPEKDDGGKRSKPERERLSPVMTQIRTDEEKSLQDWLDALGTQGAFKVQVRREKPKTFRDPVSKKDVKTDGYLETFDHTIDEEFIQNTFGGGSYYLKVTRRSADGSYRYEKGLHRNIDIAGDPRLDRLPSNPDAPASALPVATGGESPVLMKEVVGLLRDSMDRKHEPQPPKGIDPAISMVIAQMREDAAARASELAELRRELSEARNQKPAADPIKDRLLEGMIDGQSGHVEALRLRYEAELRQTKELAASELDRARRSAEEDAKRQWDRFERMMSELKAAHEREIATIRTSNEVSFTASRSSSDLQSKIYDSEMKRLERENQQLREEVKELRAKKDKPLLEQLEEIDKIKEIVGGGDADKTSFDKFIDVLNNPAAAEFVKGVVGKGEAPAQAAAAQAQQQPQAQRRPQVMQTPGGEKMLVYPNGRAVPIKKKPKIIPSQVNPDGTVTPEIVLPQIDEATVSNVVGYLERAYQANQDPEIVAQSGKAMVPDEILAWIRDNHTEQASGVDLFMTKVAKLPGNSPLSAQSGRNWLRKVGKALIGE